jgi:hypothetical protein
MPAAIIMATRFQQISHGEPLLHQPSSQGNPPLRLRPIIQSDPLLQQNHQHPPGLHLSQLSQVQQDRLIPEVAEAGGDNGPGKEKASQ